MATEPIQSALPKGPEGATGAQDVNGELRWHDAAGKDLGSVQGNAQHDNDFAEMGTATQKPANTQSDDDDWGHFGVATAPPAHAGNDVDWSSFGTAAPKPQDNNPLRGAAEATGIGARTSEVPPMSPGDRALYRLTHLTTPEDVASVHNWLDDVQADRRNGTGATWVGRALQALGAKGTSSGNSEQLGDVMSGPLAGVPQVGQGVAEVHEGHPVRGANDIIGGVGTSMGPLTVSQPEALPFIAAGMVGQKTATEVAKAVGADDETSELVGNVVGLVTGGLTTEHGRAGLATAADVAKTVAGKLADSVSDSKLGTKVGDTVGAAMGRTNDFNTAIRRISEPTKKQFGGYVEKIENVSSDLQSILNDNPKIESPEQFADAIDKHIEKTTQELGRRAGATKESGEPIVPNVMQRIDERLDKFFDDNKGRYGTADQVEQAKQNIRDRVMQERGAKEPGDFLELREPNMFEGENIRKGFKDSSKTAPGMPEGANEAAAQVAADEMRTMLDEGFRNRGVDNVKEVRAKQADLIDIRDKIREAQQKAEEMGQPGLLKTATKKIGTPGIVIALALGHPVSATGIGAAFLGEKIYNNIKNPNVNIGRAAELAGRNPAAAATELEHVVPPAQATPATAPTAPAAPEPAPLPPPVDHALHGELATAFHTTIDGSNVDELKTRFLDGLRKRQADAQAAGKTFEPTPKEEAVLGKINASDAKTRQAAYDEQVKVAEAQKVTAAKQAAEAQKAQEKAAAEAKAAADKAEQDRLAKVAEARDKAGELDEATEFNKPEVRTAMEDKAHVLPHEYEISIQHEGEEAPDLEVVRGYSHKDALDNAMKIYPTAVDWTIEREVPREPQPYAVPTDKVAPMPRSATNGKSAVATINHEMGHVFVNHVNGIESSEVISHRHPALKGTDGRAAAYTDFSKYQDPETGEISEDVLKNPDDLNKVLDAWMGGIAADEVFNGIDRNTNAGGKADRKSAKSILKMAGVEGSDADAAINQAIDRGKEVLTHPVTRAIIKENTPFREEGLAPTHHYSQERITSMKEEHDARMAQHDFEEQQREAEENPEPEPDGGGKARAAKNDEPSVHAKVSEGHEKVESRGKAEDGRPRASESKEVSGERRTGTANDRPQVAYKPSEKAATLSAERPNYGPEFDAAQNQHEIDRNKSILRNPKATPEDTRVARENLFHLQNPDLAEAQKTALTENAKEKSELANSADAFNAERGREPVEAGTTHSPEVAGRIAKAFEEMKHEPDNPKVKAAYDAAKNDIDDQWNYATQKMGVKFEPWTKEGQPYANSKEMVADVKNNKHLYFFQGGELPADHPLGAVDPKTGLTYNDKLRAVHDLFGHAANENQFGPKGEENAWNEHRQMFSPEALPAITSETRGQNSWVNFGDHLRVPFKEGRAIPAERTTGESALDEAIRSGGGVPGGRMTDAKLGLDLSMFHDPTTGSTLALKTADGVTPEKVRQKLVASRADYLRAHPEESRIPEKGQPGYVAPTQRPYAQNKAGILPEEFHRPNEAPKTPQTESKDWADIDLQAHPAGGIDPNTGSMDSKRVGFEIYPEARQVLDHPPTPADFKAYAEQHADILKQHPDLKIGWDTTGTKPELNIGISTDNEAAAKRVAAKLDQRSAWDTQKNEEIPTGGKGEATAFPDYPFEQRLADLGDKTPQMEAAEDQTVVRPKGSSVELHDNPLKIKGTSESGAPNTVDVAMALNKFTTKQHPALDLNKAEPAEMVARAKSIAEDEARYQLAQNNNGAAWYTTDMKTHDAILQDMRPELADPAKLSMFKMAEAVLSSGQKPYGNFKAAIRAWDTYQETGKFPPTNPETGRSWGPRNVAAYGNALESINRLIAEKGEQGASDWLLADHTVEELRDYNKNVSGKKTDVVPGATILGPKRGPFAQNLHGLESAFTADMWVSRTWNRWMGTAEVAPDGELATDAPRSDKERNLMKQSFAETADKLKMSTSALQAVLWYYEQALYSVHGSAKESWSFSDAARRAKDEEDSSFKFGANEGR